MASRELQQVGPYIVTQLLGEHATSRFYLGRHQQRKKEAFIKVFLTPLSTNEAKEAFLTRAKQLKRLKHRHIIEVQDFGFLPNTDGAQDCAYLVTQYAAGGSIATRIVPGQRIPADEVKRILSPIADALHYAHINNIVHGNLHPGNLLVGERSETLLTDFSFLLPGGLPSLNSETASLPYRAPEHLQGTCSAASDQYALAVMVYEWLCGCRPYQATELETLLRQQEQEPLPPPRSLNQDISPAVEQVLLQALARDPDERFPHAQAFADAYLRALMGFSMKVEARQAKPPLPKDMGVPQHSAPRTGDNGTTKGDTPYESTPPRITTASPTQGDVIDAGVTRDVATHLVSDDITSDKRIEADVFGSKVEQVSRPVVRKSDDTLGKSMDTDTEETAIDDSRLSQIVSADLCQGGILSRRLSGYEERTVQIEMAGLVARSLRENTHAIVEAGTGTGKALDTDTPIPTPTGWKRMGDLVVGDFVFDEKGYPTRVTAAFDVMYDRTCYEVVFSDGSSLVADAEHEWASYTSVDRSWAGRSQSSTYLAKNFVTSDQLARLDQLIALSGLLQNDDALSVHGAMALIGGHHWSVYQAARKIAPANSDGQPTRYPRQTLLTAVRDRLTRDLAEQRRDGRAYTLVTTEQMAATLMVNSSARANHAVAVAGSLVLPDADLPIEPYFLGAWLGDGSCRNNQITSADPALITEITEFPTIMNFNDQGRSCHAEHIRFAQCKLREAPGCPSSETLRFAQGDNTFPMVVGKNHNRGTTVRSLKRPYLYAVDDENGKAVSRWQPGMTGRLRALGLYLNKHIPVIYLRASEQQRRALLAGLLDTDGTVNRCGAVEFTTTNPQLKQDVYELMCSLGFRPSLRQGRARCNGKDCGPKWTLAFTTDQQVFRLERKVVAHKERLRNYTPERNRFRYVVAVHEVPSRPVRCIQVESESHLYLAGRSMIPTHNSLAYLLPVVRSGKVAIISTANKALQEQLFYKDIPFVQKHIKYVDAALVKGMGNYVCLDRVEEERVGLQFYAKNRDFTRLLTITKDDESGFNGDFETLGFSLAGDIRSRVNADSDQCAWSKCGFYAECYVRKMRVKAEHAKLIVVNHTLLLLDALLEGHLLPERDVVIVDEAHHLEEEATRCFTVTVSPLQVSTLLAQRMLKEHTPAILQDETNQVMMRAWDRLAQVADPGFKGRANLQAPLEEGLLLSTTISKLADELFAQRPKDMPEKETQLYDKLLARTQNLAEHIRTVFSVAQPGQFVYYVERVNTPGRRGGQLEASAAPLDVTSFLKEQLFSKCNVICTSATLATVGPNPLNPEDKGPNFAYFRRRVGLDSVDYPNTLERILPLTFDYESNALLYLPRDLPEPVYGTGSDGYAKKIADRMCELVEASRGRAFLLFSSKRMLEAVYNLFLESRLDFPLLRQGDLPRIELTRQFREEEGAVLFGLKSFWEGVDIAGEALSLVVIDKLPFDPPDDPVHEARVAQMKARGENWFGTYVLPQTVLRLKQGLGRLLRTREDRGVMAILDTRLHTKSYGRTILAALPPARKTANLKEVAAFFSEEQAPF